MVRRKPDPDREPSKAARLALMVAQGESLRAGAKALGISDRTARRWAADPRFKERVDRLRAEMTTAAVGRLADASVEAVETLAKLMRGRKSSATVQLAAARAILEKLPIMSEFFDLSERVRQLEQRVDSTRDPWEKPR